MKDAGTITEVHPVTPPQIARDRANVSVRGVVATGLIVGAMQLLFHGQELWQAAVGLPDLPGAEIWALMFAATMILGLLFANPVASLAAGVAGFGGMLAGLALAGNLEDFFDTGRGFDLSWLQFIAVPAGAHVLGVSIRRLVSNGRGSLG